MVRAVMFAAVLLFAASPAVAQYYNEAQLAKVKEVHVAVQDSVGDGCLPQPDALKVEAELILRRAGIKVAPSWTPASHSLSIWGVGYAWGGGCTVVLIDEMFRFESLSDGTLGSVLAARFNSMWSGSKDRSQSQLRETVNEHVTALANEILKARQK